MTGCQSWDWYDRVAHELVGESPTDRSGVQLFTSGQVAVGVYGTASLRALLFLAAKDKRTKHLSPSKRGTSWSRETYHLLKGPGDVRQGNKHPHLPTNVSDHLASDHESLVGLHPDRSLLHRSGSSHQIFHSSALPAHLRLQQKAHDCLLGSGRRRRQLQHRPDRHVHLPMRARAQGLEPCDAGNVPEHFRRSDEPCRSQRGR